MSDKVNLRAIERKAYASYHNDGLLDLFVGLVLTSGGVGILAGITMIVAVFPALMFPIWTAGKKGITEPRMGIVEFSPTRRGRNTREKRFFVLFFSFTMLLGVVVFYVFATRLDVMRAVAENLVFGSLALIGGVGFAAMAWWKGIPRYYAYAALVVVVLIFGGLAHVDLPYLMIAVGAPILIGGVVTLMRFLKRYPKPGDMEGHPGV